MGFYPIAVDVTDRPCLIVGGGDVAYRKLVALREAGAVVTVISPEIDPRMESYDGLTVIRREYQPGDTSGYVLVFAATGNRPVNAAVYNEAVRGNIPVNVVDDPELCSFIVPAVVRRGGLLIAITTSGKSPALSKKIRRELEKSYGEEYSVFVDLMGELREITKAEFDTQAEREALFNRLLDSEIFDLIRADRIEDARRLALDLIREHQGRK
ncbi:MAG: bifunctional precorrin-2 dehydrogenase/sirohydrochlorin ferrochelatase [Armatimonadetes bacterium]|nr:bifunctional precorrin-2 dehydrogenase/sirohydrochlorin ferrochelatase [Armatimonadota bacterium]